MEKPVTIEKMDTARWHNLNVLAAKEATYVYKLVAEAIDMLLTSRKNRRAAK